MSNPKFRVTKYNHIECNKEKQPALHIDILNGLQASMQQSHLCPWKTTEKRLDFVQRGVNEEMPPYSYKTPRKRKPADKISFTIRGLGWDNNYYVLTTDKYTMENCNLVLNSSWDRPDTKRKINKQTELNIRIQKRLNQAKG